jgi:hypothetical protein
MGASTRRSIRFSFRMRVGSIAMADALGILDQFDPVLIGLIDKAAPH